MNILLVYPEYPETFWSFKHALKFVSKKASFPPLGLLTIASMLPKEFNKRLIDMNAAALKESDILWADFVFISSMSAQSNSADEVIKICRRLNRKVVAGGPHFTSHYKEYLFIDHLILNEAEITLKEFLKDLENGELKQIYCTDEWADITTTPVPQWDLIDKNKYTSMNLQYSRGCPYDCDFCDITVLYGRRPRTKTRQQVLAELDSIYYSGWKGPVFFVDDNFIGNKLKLKKEILPAIAEWMKAHKDPFWLNTEASINLADDDELMTLMAKAGFEAVFIGIESPNEESLIECNKSQNRHRDMIHSIRKIQKSGLEVQAGFILGFDKDPETIFQEITSFIQESGIVTAMVGLLNAPSGTKLYKRLLSEGRIIKNFTGDNTDFSMNFVPVMNEDKLKDGYRKVVNTIYSPVYYYERVMKFLKEFEPGKKKVFHVSLPYILALLRSMLYLGMIGKERVYYWKLFFWSLFRKPKLFSLSILFTIYGYHFRKVSEGFTNY